MMAHALRALVLAAFLLSGASCERHVSEPEPGPPGIRFIVGNSVTDTIQTELLALTVEVRDSSGALRPNLVVDFKTVFLDPRSGVLVGYRLGATYGTYATDTTDAKGRASVRVQLGWIAGPGAVQVSVPQLGFQDTARYSILPGKPTRVMGAPEDTAVYVDGGYQLRTTVQDRNGNVRADPVTFSSGPSVAVLGDRIQGTSIGRGFAVVRLGALEDTAWVSVVPVGTFAAARRNSSGGSDVILSGLDGSGYRVLRREAPLLFVAPAWHPSGSRLAYRALVPASLDMRLMVSDTIGNARPVEHTTTAWHVWADYSPDGAWLYYFKYDRLYRQSVDGGPETGLYWTDRAYDLNAGNPSFSPDGTRIVFGAPIGDGGHMKVLEIATGRVRSLGVSGTTPRWSPRGDAIAYVHEGAIKVMAPDGTSARVLASPLRSPTSQDFVLGLDWSRDSQWIIARTYPDNVLRLIHVTSGLMLPLPFSDGMSFPAWRP